MKRLNKKIFSVILAIILIFIFSVVSSAQNQSMQSLNYNSIPDGTYYIKNIELNRYIQPDNDNLNVNLSELELWNTGDAEYQKWTITYLNNGYYKIINYQNGKAISIKTGDENQNNSRIIQRTYDGSSTQQWRITPTSRGYYKIAPKSGMSYPTDWCMSADDGIFYMNGWHIEQKEYTDNNYLRDEWIINARWIVGVPNNIYSNNFHLCIPCAITNVAAYWCINRGYYNFGLSNPALQESGAINVQNAMNAVGSATNNSEIQAGFNIFHHTISNTTYSLESTNCWRDISGFDWEDILTEINNDRPVMMGFAHTNDSPYTEPHMTVCVGYAEENNKKYVWLVDAHDTTCYIKQEFNIDTYNDFIAKVNISD